MKMKDEETRPTAIVKTFKTAKRALKWLNRHNSGPVSLMIGASRYKYDSGTLTNDDWYSAVDAGKA